MGKRLISNLLYPIRKYTSISLSFSIVILIICIFAFFVGISDDRGFSLKNYLTNTYIVGDFQSYRRPLNQVFNDFLKIIFSENVDNLGIIQGPIMPILISLSKLISNNYIPFFLFSLYISLWFIAISLDISRASMPWLDEQIKEKIFSIKISKKFNFQLSNIELYGIVLNPILIFYTSFPASDILFSFVMVFIIWNFMRLKYLRCYFLYIFGIAIRPTALFIYPAIIFLQFHEYKIQKKFRIITFIFLIIFTSLSYYYYKSYSVLNFRETLILSHSVGGLSIWGLPIPGWLIYQKENLILEFNKIFSILFTPIVQLISTLGIRPSYTTIFDGDTESTLAIVSIKPYIYAYIRILWGTFISLPGFIYLTLMNLAEKKVTKFTLLFLFISLFAIGLSSSIPLERYLLFCNPILSIISISFYLKLYKTIKNESKRV